MLDAQMSSTTMVWRSMPSG